MLNYQRVGLLNSFDLGVPGRCRGCSWVHLVRQVRQLTVACENQVLAGLNDDLIVIESTLQP